MTAGQFLAQDDGMSADTPSSVRDQIPLSPTPRTTLNRHHDRASVDRRDLYDVLEAALICHLGVLIDGAPLVLPTAFGVDVDGPDEGGTLYLHGSVASASLRAAPYGALCVSFTVLDGLVLARSAFHHSMNYRSAVVIGQPRHVDDPEEKRRGLDLVMEHAVPGRSSTLRVHTRKELAATSVIALSLAEASVKQRSGDPVDDAADLQNGGWAGVLPLRLVTTGVVTAADAVEQPPPADVLARAAALAWRPGP